MTDSTNSGDIIANIQGDISGQVAVGNNILQIGSVHGGVVNIFQPGDIPEPELRDLPVILRPRRVSEFLDRRSQVGSAVIAIQDEISVEFYGSDGIGKTSLLRFLSYYDFSEALSAGVIYIPGREKDLSDILQFIFNSFYKFEFPIKLQQAEFKHRLQNLNALIIIDDLELDREDIEYLLNVAPKCTYVFCSTKRLLWEDSKPIELKGLPIEESLKLAEKELGRQLTTEEIPLAETIFHHLNGIPLLILQTAALAREHNYSLEDLLMKLESSPSTEDGKELASSDLNEEQKRILAILALFGGAFVRSEHIKNIARVSDFDSILHTLIARKLIDSSEDKLSINDTLTATIEKFEGSEALKKECLSYFADWAEENKNNHDAIVNEADALMRVLRNGVDIGDWKSVLRLGRAIEGAFAAGLLWGLWFKVIQILLQAARKLGDRAAEAWALHQSGTYSLCLGDFDDATASLEQALEIRNSLGDNLGAEITRHNLNFITGATTGGRGDEVRESGEPSGGTETIPAEVVTGGTASIFSKGIWILLVILLLGVIWYIISNLGSGPIIHVSESALSFENQEVGVQSQAKKLLITTKQSEPVGIDSVQIIGRDTGDFTLNDGCSNNAITESSGGCTIFVQFKPESFGDRQAKIQIMISGVKHEEYVELYGEGVSPKSNPDVSPNELNFPRQDIGTISQNKRITINNSGRGPLEIHEIVLRGPHREDFTIVTDNCTSVILGQDKHCAIDIAFKPEAAMERRAELMITHNASNEPLTVSLTGLGNRPSPEPRISPETLEFERQPVNSQSESRTVRVNNFGRGALEIGDIHIDSDLFKKVYDSCSNTGLEFEESCSVEVIYNPGVSGQANARLLIPTSAKSEPYVVNLIGVAYVPVGHLTVNPGSVNFYDIVVKNSSEVRTVTLMNNGEARLEINDIRPIGFEKTEVRINGNQCLNRSIPHGRSCRIAISLIPLDIGRQKAIIEIWANADNSPEQIAVEWTAVMPPEPIINVSRRRLDFGAQNVNTTSGRERINVWNSGEGLLNVSRVEAVGASTGQFIIRDMCSSSSLKRKENCYIDVMYRPTSEGKSYSRLNIYSNSMKGPETVSLYGVGTRIKTEPPKPTEADLVVTSLKVTGSPKINSKGSFEVPVEVTIRNNGKSTAGIFKVSLEYNKGYTVAFTAPGDNSWYRFSKGSLRSGRTERLSGVAVLSPKLSGQTVYLRAVADSCSGDELMPKYCRVNESNENNNRSKSVSVKLSKGIVTPIYKVPIQKLKPLQTKPPQDPYDKPVIR